MDPNVTEQARELLSMIGVSDDLHVIVQLHGPSASEGFPERWRYAVATALVNPDGEDEWFFLRQCALNKFEDRCVDAGAIQTLKLTGSPRSQKILEEARRKNKGQAGPIARALDYIKSDPAALADADLEALARRTAQALDPGARHRNMERKWRAAAQRGWR